MWLQKKLKCLNSTNLSRRKRVVDFLFKLGHCINNEYENEKSNDIEFRKLLYENRNGKTLVIMIP